MYSETVNNVIRPYLADLLKLIEDASGKYLHGTGVSEIVKL